MASLEGQQEISTINQAAENKSKRSESREGSAERKVSKDRDEKLRYARERQNEERQRKIEELKAQAEAAQRYREQKEEERRRRIEEIRLRDTEKRNLVEERKKAIIEAEKERREYILKKNQERDSRLEIKRRDRNSIGFAFGSSTPRLLEPADFGTVSPSTFWGQRRSTSISNVAGASLSRRSSERELADSGAKKRATSASGTDRHDGSRSGNVTPGGHISTSRPGSAMSTSTTMSNSGYVARRPVPAQRKQRPASIAGTGVSLEEINKLKRENNRPPVKITAGTSSTTSSAQTTPKRTSNLMSTSMIVTSSSTRMSSTDKKTPKREPPAPKASSAPKSITKTVSSERINKVSKDSKPKEVASVMAKSMIVTNSNNHSNQLIEISDAENLKKATGGAIDGSKSTALDMTGKENAFESVTLLPVQSKEEKDAFNSIKTEEEFLPSIEAQKDATGASHSIVTNTNTVLANEEKIDLGNEKLDNEPELVKKPRSKENSVVRELTPPNQAAAGDGGNDLMTASMIARKITTEEQAKAALAERRRLAREEAERQAELERQKLEAERIAEIKRQEEEAERQRQFEEEATRMAEEQRSAEEERLRKAIEDAQQREDEERRKREEEERQRLEREEAEKKAKEEAEKQRIEVAERLKREEKEREERRKRVEAIMSRTRKGNPAGASAGGAATQNVTQAKASNNDVANLDGNQQQSETNNSEGSGVGSNISTSTSGSSSTSTAPTTPTPIPATHTDIAATLPSDPLNSQAMYEQSVVDKENSLINSFNNMIIDENVKNLHQQIEVSNGKLHAANYSNSDSINNTTSVANGNGHAHIENENNKNDINILQDVVAPATNQLIDLSIESQDLNNPLNFNNNNSLLTTTTLVTADSHENKDISLL